MILNEISIDFSRIDSFGLIVSAVGWGIVFLVLVVLFQIYNNIPRLIKLISKTKESRVKSVAKEVVATSDISGEVNAAISMALYLYLNELHDQESGVITIKRVNRRYSPWSSKIYSLNTYFQQR